jgi:hypothetical protein
VATTGHLCAGKRNRPSLPTLPRRVLDRHRPRGTRFRAYPWPHARPRTHRGGVSRAGGHAACWLALGLFGGWHLAMRSPASLAAEGAHRRHVIRRKAGAQVRWARRRPELEGLEPLTAVVTQLSFPSAHATTSARPGGVPRLAPTWALYLAAGVFAVSRPYLGGALSERRARRRTTRERDCRAVAGIGTPWRVCSRRLLTLEVAMGGAAFP